MTHKLAADLHIHSCLSPCSDDSMTPNNIVGMAQIKELDVIAVCDHNTALNLPAVSAVAREAGVLLLPGIEAETREEVHMLCYLPTVDAALELGDYLYSNLPAIPNKPKFFGNQNILDEDDEQTGTLEKLLIQSTTLSIEEIADKCRALGGVPVPAHINRPANSIIANLGFIPPKLAFKAVEVYKGLPVQGVDLAGYHVLSSSDAHDLGAILERESFISAAEQGVEGILEWLRS